MENEVKNFDEVKDEITMPDEIAPFWRSPIKHPLNDLCFDIFKIENNRWKKIDLPVDPIIGKITPPLEEEEIVAIGGSGIYLFRPKSIKTGRYVGGSETHRLGIVKEEKTITKEENKKDTLIEFMQLMFERQMEMFNNILQNISEAIKELKSKKEEETKPQVVVPDMSEIFKSMSNMIMEIEKAKLGIETKKYELEKSLEMKKLELTSRLNELKTQVEGVPNYEKLKEEIEASIRKIQEEKPKSINWQEIIANILQSITDFFKNITPAVKSIQDFSKTISSVASLPQTLDKSKESKIDTSKINKDELIKKYLELYNLENKEGGEL
uniref:Uncharacterized protein n=1 Tax=candidate division WOR-3 bacterium TaxID=2052148 RepID=A0A7V4E384_UNCW3